MPVMCVCTAMTVVSCSPEFLHHSLGWEEGGGRERGGGEVRKEVSEVHVHCSMELSKADHYWTKTPTRTLYSY